MRPYLEGIPEKRKIVMIRGYGDWSYPTICTYQTKAYEDEAIGVIEQYLDSLQEGGEYRRERYTFEVRTEDDGHHLFGYSDGRIHNDKRGIPLPKDKKKRVLIRIYDGKQSPPKLRSEFYDFEEQFSLAADLFLELERRSGGVSEIYFEVLSKEDHKLMYRYKDGVVYDRAK